MTGLALVAVLAATGTPKGGPQVVVLDSPSNRAGLLVSFTVGRGEPAAVVSQATELLLLANPGLPRSFATELFAVNGTLTATSSSHGVDVLLVAPRPAFHSLARRLLEALMPARIDRGRYEELAAHEPPAAAQPSLHEQLLVDLQAVLDHDVPPMIASLPSWSTAARMTDFANTYFVPANARVVIMGDTDKGFESALRRTGGEKVVLSKVEPVPYLRETFRSSLHVHLLGLRLPEQLTAKELATVRLTRLLLVRHLMEHLRRAGVVYTAEALFVNLPTFHGILAIIPAFDSSGLDLETPVLAELEPITHGAITEAEFTSARQTVIEETSLMRADPQHFLELVRLGNAELEWLGDEHRQTLESLTFEQFQASAKHALVDQRNRFSLKLSPMGGEL